MLLMDRDMTGSEATFARRLRQLVEAKQTGSRSAMRGAVVEVAVAAAAWAAQIDLEGPELERRPRE